jgi:TrpR family trp operon transcriptional repressor
MQILIDYLLNIKDPAILERKLRALLTAKEEAEMQHRLQILELLGQGLPQREIAERLGVGIATVTRGARAFKELQQDD